MAARASISLVAAMAAAAIAVMFAWWMASGPSAPSASPPSPTPPASSGSPSPPGASQRSPFTGLPTDLTAPVLAVKIDNTVPARPQTGLAAADVVYVEPVEGGLSRFIAVFQSDVPPVVGPVRSLRRTDLQLLTGFGSPVALAFSGEAPELRPRLRAAPVIDVSQDERPGAYFRKPSRPVPHNLYARARELLVGNPPQDIGFRFGPAPPGGQPVSATAVSYGSADIGVRWSDDEQRWVFRMDGEPLRGAEGNRPGAATVVFQQVEVVPTRIRDSAGNVSPFAKTVGSGDAVVLRNGQAFEARWSRPSKSAPTTFTRPNGDPMLFARGPVWIVLVGGSG